MIYFYRWGAKLPSGPWLLPPSPEDSRPPLAPGTLTPRPSSSVPVPPPWVWPGLVPVLGLCSVPLSLDTPATLPSNSSFSPMPFLGLLCLKPWVCSALWWLSCCSLPSKSIYLCTVDGCPQSRAVSWPAGESVDSSTHYGLKSTSSLIYMWMVNRDSAGHGTWS